MACEGPCRQRLRRRVGQGGLGLGDGGQCACCLPSGH